MRILLNKYGKLIKFVQRQTNKRNKNYDRKILFLPCEERIVTLCLGHAIFNKQPRRKDSRIKNQNTVDYRDFMNEATDKSYSEKQVITKSSIRKWLLQILYDIHYNLKKVAFVKKALSRV